MSGSQYVAIVPAAPVLLGRYAGMVDPVPEMRAAVHAAVDWLVEHSASIDVLVGDEYGELLAEELLAAARVRAPEAAGPRVTESGGLLVLADGTARRGEKAPGHFDERAEDYDAAITLALRSGDRESLTRLDLALGAELLAAGAPLLTKLAGRVGPVTEAQLDHADCPHGVQYWIARWRCES